MKTTSALFLAATLAAANIADAANTPLPRIGVPRVTKLDWNIYSPAVADLNADGLNDLAVLNNDTGRIELLYQYRPGEAVPEKRALRSDRWTPVLEDSLFRRESIPGDAAMRALAVGDLNGDGLPDIVFTSERGGLQVIFQGPEKGQWREPLKDKTHTPVRNAKSLKIFPLERGPNSPRALVQQTAEGIAVRLFKNDANAKTPLASLPAPVLLRTNGDSGRLFVQNILGGRGPGRRAIGTISSGETETRLSFRLQTGPGLNFGPEITLRAAAASIDLDTPLQFTPGQPPAFTALNPRQRTLSTATFTQDDRSLAGAETAALQTYALPAAADSADAFARFDADGDGLPDIVTTDSKAAKLLIYRALPNGNFADPAEYPTLPGVTSIAPLDKNNLLLLVGKDKVLATTKFVKGIPAFPVPLTIPVPQTDWKPDPAIPHHLAAGNGMTIVFAAVPTLDSRRVQTTRNTLFKVTPRIPHAPECVEASNSGSAASPEWELTPIADCESRDPRERDIRALRIGDLNGDGLPDILAFIDRGAARIWTQSKDGKFAEAAKDSVFRKSMLEGVTPADVAWATADAAGTPALLVAYPGFLRALRLDADGDLKVLFQANTRRAADRLRAPLSLGPGKALVAYNETQKALEWFERDVTGTFQSQQLISTDSFSPFEGRTQTVANENLPRLLYTTAGRIVQIPTARRGLRVETKRIYESDLEGFTPQAAFTGVLLPAPAVSAASGTPAAAAPNARRSRRGVQASIVQFDFSNRSLQILHPGSDGQWGDALHFTLFDENPHYRGRRDSGPQPRDAFTADLTGDGIGDLVLLMHDRVFVYPGLK